MKNLNKVTVISYYSTVNSVTAEWVQDKIYAFEKLGKKVILITSTSNPIIKSTNYKVIRVPSIAPTIFFAQLKSNFKDNLLIHMFYLPLVITFGIFVEITERILLKRLGDGQFSWTFLVIIAFFLHFFKTKGSTLFSTGGPLSSHISSLIIKMITNSKTIIELQDPLVGEDIGSNDVSAKYLSKLEKYIIENASKVIFVTKRASIECQKRYPKYKNQIYGIYTSSKKNHISSQPFREKKPGELRFLHLGTLYSTRNLFNLDKAIENILKNYPNLNIEIENVGRVSKENQYNSRNYSFKIINKMNRKTGLNYTYNFDVLLLIQHTDNRSKLTIPYKTWDYLNTGLPILGLVNNNELKNLLISYGHLAVDNSNIKLIEDALLKIINNDIYDNVIVNKIDIVEQTRLMIE